VIKVSKYSGSISGLSNRIRRALQHLEDGAELGKLTFIGPIPVFGANAALFGRGATLSSIKTTGWRGVVMGDGDPLAVVELPLAHARDIEGAIRGKEPASALWQALELVNRRFAHSKDTYELRFMALPEIFITALWLKGRRSQFIPTRAGHGLRPKPRVLGRNSFIKLVRTMRGRIKTLLNEEGRTT